MQEIYKKMNNFKKIMAVLAIMLPTCFTVKISTYAMKEKNAGNNKFNITSDNSNTINKDKEEKELQDNKQNDEIKLNSNNTIAKENIEEDKKEKT